MNTVKIKYPVLLLLFSFFCLPATIFSQETENAAPQSDSLFIAADSSLVTDTVADSIAAPPKKQKMQIDAPITYTARDSIVLFAAGNAFLYGDSKVVYGQMELTADRITLNPDSALVYARGTIDEEDELIGTPVFKDNGAEYQAKELNYNFDTKKGYIVHGHMQEGEGYIISEEAKKVSDDVMCMKNGKYTTCDDPDCPHFYLALTKAKMKSKKWVVSGPAYLVVADVPLPLALPFGFFPITKSYSSGLLLPSYGDDLTRGFFLTGGGYYFALSDYIDLTLTGDIYTKGTWAVQASSTYLKKYKFRGNVNASFRRDITGDKGLPNYAKMNNFALTWTHTQDPKSSPNSTLSASVNFSSSGYDRSNVQNFADPMALSQNTKGSSISFGYRFPDSPFSLSTSFLVNQRTADSTISVTLPDLTVTMSRIFPFKRKNALGKERWYEKIYLSYDARISNSIETKESKLFKSSLIKDWRNGIDQTLRTGASFNLFRYISITPSANYHERWYFRSIGQSWDNDAFTAVRDTSNGFYRSYDFALILSMSTKLYGFYTPVRKIFGNKIDRIRHVVTPTLSYSYTPDFGKPFWGSWRSYMRPISPTDPTQTEVFYSPYEGAPYGYPGRGEVNMISFSLGNNLEMKWRHLNDSTGEPEYKTISLIDALNISNIGYNFAADSLNWSNMNVSLRLKFTQSFSLSLSGGFETYLYGLNEFGNPIRINTPRWKAGKFPRLIGTSTSFSYTFNNQTFKRKKKTAETETPAVDEDGQTPEPSNAKKKKKDQENLDDDGYTKVSIPWSLSFDYSVRFGSNGEFDKNIMEYKRELSHNLGIRGSINLTPKWSITFNASYDFNLKQITYSSLSVRRDLHCWSMSASIVPFGPYKNYNFLIQVNASSLSDLKHEIHSDYYRVNWY